MKAVVVGCGSMGRRRIRHALGAGAQVSVYDIREDRMAEVAARHPVNRLGGPEAIAAAAPDALFICVPPAWHEDYISWAIDHSVHFMVEQPISHRLVNLDRILAGVRARKLTVHVSNNHRFSAEIAAMRSVISSGGLGPLLSVIVERGEWLPDWHPYEPYTDYYPSKRSMGGGLDAICDYAWMRDLFGEPAKAVSLNSKRSSLDIDTDDVVQIVFDFPGGPQVVLHCDMIQRPYAGEVKLIFERAILTHTAPDPFVRVYSAEAKAWRELPLDDDREAHGSMQGKINFNFVEPMYERDTRFFLDRLAAGDRRTDSLEDGIACLRTIHPLVGGLR